MKKAKICDRCDSEAKSLKKYTILSKTIRTFRVCKKCMSQLPTVSREEIDDV